jgi:tRNA1(Val) A37 N6-methylase TrmN6
VFLAASLSAVPGETVLDLGCGVGVAMLCLQARLPGLILTGVEIQPELAALARRNLAENGFEGSIYDTDASDLPAELKAQTFDHVMTNPPFFQREVGTNARNPSREAGRRETMDLGRWIGIALRRLRPGGTLVMVNRIERLPDCLSSMNGRLGDLRILPLSARTGRPAKLFILKGKKGAGGQLALLPPLVLHRGAAHERDGESYTPEAQAVLRQGRGLEFDI